MTGESNAQSECLAFDPTAFPWEEPATDELAPGYVVADKYAIKAVLGRGGFAVVYDAEHLALRRAVALKVLHRAQGMPNMLLDRFAREVRIAALVRHPNVLEVHDAGVLPDGSPFLVMEKIAGLTLYEKQCMEQQLDIDECLELSAQLLTALMALAERGIVHRDIKPENLMLTRGPEGELRLKLVDFGIALVRDERIEPRLTLQGALVGTPHYMAPEQLRCEVVDARVDLYATGVVMYQVLTGKLPYEGETLSALTSSVLYGSAAALTTLRPDCPPKLAALIERALARAPEERFQSASEMLEALSCCRDPLRSSVASEPPLTRVLRRMKRPRDLAIAVTLLGVGAIVPEQVSFASALRSAFPGAFPRGVAAAPANPTALAAGTAQLDAAPSLGLAPSGATPGVAAAGSAPSVTALPSTPLHAARVASVSGDRASSALAPRTDGRPQAASSSAALRDRDKALALTRRGLTLYLHGELDAAYAVYRQATLLANTQAPAFRGLGLCASRLGRKAEARRAFARYLELASDAADAHLIRARLNTLNGER